MQTKVSDDKPIAIIKDCRIDMAFMSPLGQLFLFKDQMMFLKIFSDNVETFLDIYPYKTDFHGYTPMKITIFANKIKEISSRKPGFISRLRFGSNFRRYEVKLHSNYVHSLLMPIDECTQFEAWVNNVGQKNLVLS